MRPWHLSWLACLLLALTWRNPGRGEDFAEQEVRNAQADLDKQVLRRNGISSGTPDLLTFLKGRTGDDADLRRLEALLLRLGSDDFEQREGASKRVTDLGPAALPRLREIIRGKDREAARRADECIPVIQRRWKPEVLSAVVRLLIRSRPDQAAEALLRHLPYVADEDLEEEIWFGLDTLAVRDPKTLAVLADALGDDQPARRAVAACVLGRRDPPRKADVSKRLADVDPVVRLRAAQGLLAAGEREAVPVLIALLEHPSADLTWQAEELLHYVAGENGPDVVLGAAGAAERKHCREAWESWWKEQGAKVDLGRAGEWTRRPGLVLVTGCDPAGKTGRVWLVGCDGKTRWQLAGLASPTDARLLPGNRVLVVDGTAASRDLAGTVAWEYKALRPVLCQPGPNGAIFLAENGPHFAYVSPEGDEISLTKLDDAETLKGCLHPQRLRDGRVFFRREEKGRTHFLEYDPADGSIEMKAIPNTIEKPAIAGVEEGRGGRYLVAASAVDALVGDEAPADRVLEWDEHRIYRRIALATCRHAARLCNGNILICAAGRMVEMDRDDRIVWESLSEEDPVRVRPCFRLLRLGFDSPRPEEFDLALAVAPRLAGLKSQEAGRRRRSVVLLGEAGPSAAEAIPALTELLKGPDEEMQAAARTALAEIRSDATRELRKAAKEGNPEARCKAIYRLGKYPRDARVIVPVLIEALKEKDKLVRFAAATNLGGMSREAPLVVPALMTALEDAESDVRLVAVQALGRLKRKAKPAVPSLIKAIKGDDVNLRAWAARSLGMIGSVDPTIVPALAQMLKDKNHPSTRGCAALALGSMGGAAKEAIPALLEALGTNGLPEEAAGRELRESAIWALGAIGPDANEAIPDLIRIVQDEKDDPKTRGVADKAIHQIREK